MNNPRKRSRNKLTTDLANGFTIIELVVVMSVISVLALIAAISYGSWLQTVTISQLKSDLKGAVTAMEDARNFGNSYPLTVPSTFTKSNDETTLTGGSNDGRTYCISISSSKFPSIIYHVESSHSKTPQSGGCTTFSLTVSVASTGGTVSGGGAFSPGSLRQATASPSTYYVFSGWSNCSTATTTTITVTMDSDKTCVASFTPIAISAPTTPVVAANTVGATTTYSWGAASCPGNTARYQYRYTISPSGYDSGLIATASTSVAFTTSTAGQTYTVATQAQCYNAVTSSSWSAAGQGSYYRPSTGWSYIAANSQHACALNFAGKAYCWGINYAGQLGNGSTVSSSVPVAVTSTGVLSGKTLVAITNGGGHTCALDSLGKAYCWGYNPAMGTLGNGSTVSSSVPVAVTSTGVLSGKTLVDVAGGEFHTCVLDSLGKAYCWGYNADGRLGNNSTVSSTVPVAVTSTGVLSGKTLIAIKAASDHTCALDSLGKAYCWGSNSSGKLGNNSTVRSSVPVAVTSTGVLSGKTLIDVGISGNHTCALDSFGKAYCWGDGYGGALGNGSTVSSLVPVAVTSTGVLSGKTLVAIAAGGSYDHTCALDSLGKAYCWGAGAFGVLGNNAATDSSVPVAVTSTGVLSGKKLSSISVGGIFTCAVASDGTGYCWGNNDNGEFGNNTLTSSLVPVAVRLAP